jgi:hypothetical protein
MIDKFKYEEIYGSETTEKVDPVTEPFTEEELAEAAYEYDLFMTESQCMRND